MSEDKTMSIMEELTSKVRKGHQHQGRIDPITFIEDPSLGNMPLWPGQKIIIKLLYGMDLDEEEEEWIRLEDNGHPVVHIPKEGFRRPEGYNEALLVLGGRSGKTTIISACTCYEAATRLYRKMGLVQRHEYAWHVVVATRLDQAEDLGRAKIYNFFAYSPTLREMIIPEVRGKRKADDINGPRLGSTLKRLLLFNGNAAVAFPCNSRAGRGYPIPVLILDELAHYFRETSTQNGDMDVYDALQIRTMQFGRYKRIFKITTPSGQYGLAYNDYLARERKEKDQLVVHAPTYMMNPMIPEEEFERVRAEDSHRWDQEICALFVDRVMSLMDVESVNEAFDSHRYEPNPREHGVERLMELDPAFKTDTFAIAIGHWDHSDGSVIIELLDGLEPKRERGAKRKLETRPGSSKGRSRIMTRPVTPDEAIVKIQMLCADWGVGEVWSDQHHSHVLIDRLKDAGVPAHSSHITSTARKSMYAILKNLLAHRRVWIVGRNTKFGERCRVELKSIRVQQGPTGVTVITKGRGAHDDFADVVARLCWRLWRRYGRDSANSVLPPASMDSAWKDRQLSREHVEYGPRWGGAESLPFHHEMIGEWGGEWS